MTQLQDHTPEEKEKVIHQQPVVLTAMKKRKSKGIIFQKIHNIKILIKSFFRLPNFKLGPTGIVKGYYSTPKSILDRDSSPEKSSLNTGEEQSSSLSEQAWDNYQVRKKI